jgi:PadR family transcriptional regulator PadR
MDSQLKKGMLEACVLSVLERGDSYGYRIVKSLAPAIDISESTLYPVLKRLEAAGCLEVYAVEHNSRLRKYYQINEAGRARVAEFLGEWGGVMDVYNYIKEGHEPYGQK